MTWVGQIDTNLNDQFLAEIKADFIVLHQKMGNGKIQQNWDWVVNMIALIGRGASFGIGAQRIPELDGLFKVLVLEEDDSLVDDGHFIYSVKIAHLLFVR